LLQQLWRVIKGENVLSKQPSNYMSWCLCQKNSQTHAQGCSLPYFFKTMKKLQISIIQRGIK